MPAPVDPEVKAAACAELATGASLGQIARKYGVNKSTAHAWKLHLAAEGGSFLRSQPVSTEKAAERLDEFGQLLTTYVRESLETLVVQVRHSRDPDWLKTQDAGDLAVLHGVLTDKIIRILEAAERAADVHSRRLIDGAFTVEDEDVR